MEEVMKEPYIIYVISNNRVYKDLLSKAEGVSLVVEQTEVAEGVNCNALFIDGAIVSVSELMHIRLLYPGIPMFYRIVNVQNAYLQRTIITTCDAYEVVPIEENFTEEQVVEDIEIHLFQKTKHFKRRIVSFFGTHSGAGVSTTLINVADLLAKRIKGRVLVLSLNPWDASDYFLDYKGQYLNDLKIDLNTKSLSDEKLQQAIHHYPDSFYHLAGNRDIKLQRFFKIEEIDYLLERARSLFDVVLVDGGPHFDNACYAQAYRSSDLRFLVTTQEPKGYQGYWPHIFSQLLEPLGASTHDFLLVLNQFSPENELGTEKDISEQLNIPLLSTIPNEGVLGSSAITQKRLLHENGVSKEYKQALNLLVRAIIKQYQLEEVEGVEEISTGGIMSKLFNRNKAVVG